METIKYINDYNDISNNNHPLRRSNNNIKSTLNYYKGGNNDNYKGDNDETYKKKMQIFSQMKDALQELVPNAGTEEMTIWMDNILRRFQFWIDSQSGNNQMCLYHLMNNSMSPNLKYPFSSHNHTNNYNNNNNISRSQNDLLCKVTIKQLQDLTFQNGQLWKHPIECGKLHNQVGMDKKKGMFCFSCLGNCFGNAAKCNPKYVTLTQKMKEEKFVNVGIQYKGNYDFALKNSKICHFCNLTWGNYELHKTGYGNCRDNTSIPWFVRANYAPRIAWFCCCTPTIIRSTILFPVWT